VISRYSLHILLGHINHSLFWKNLAPAYSEGRGNGGSLQPSALSDAIVQSFGSLDALKKEFNATTAGIQGSGWGWLVRFLCFQTDCCTSAHNTLPSGVEPLEKTIFGPINTEGVVYAVCYSPDAKMIATSAIRGGLKIWNANSGELLSDRFSLTGQRDIRELGQRHASSRDQAVRKYL
jgi:WD40 repeat protein